MAGFEIFLEARLIFGNVPAQGRGDHNNTCLYHKNKLGINIASCSDHVTLAMMHPSTVLSLVSTCLLVYVGCHAEQISQPIHRLIVC